MVTRLNHATVITPRGNDVAVLHDHTIEFEGPRITGVFSPAERSARGAVARTNANEIDGSRWLVIPGLVNTHHHLFQSLTRGRPAVQNATLFEWLVGQYPVWRGLDHAALKLAATISLAELLLGGGTTTSDHHYLFPRGSNVQIEAVLEAAESLGMRIHVCRGSMTLGQSGGGLPPDDCTEDDATVLADYERVLERFHDARLYAMRRIDLAPCSPFNVTPELFRDTVGIARSRGVLLHTHAAETLDEEAYCLEKYGCRPIRFFHDRGWLGEDVYLAHCVHLNAEEISLLAETRTGLSHCPVSNMRLGSGVAPLVEWMAAGCKVGLGVDGSASNDGGHLLHAARQAMLLQRVVHGPRAVTAGEALRLATVGGAAVLHRPELGRIEVDSAADLVCFRRDDIALAGAVEQDPLGALLLCHVARPEAVFVNGSEAVREGQVMGIDLGKAIAEFNGMVRKRFR